MNFLAKVCSLVLLVALLFACGKKEPIITTQDVESARQQGQLEQLYRKVNADLTTASGSRKQSLIAISTQIERQIAADKQADILQQIEDSRLPLRVVALSRLDQLATEAKSIKQYDATRFQQVVQKISAERSETQTALAKQLVAVGNISVSDTLQRLNAQSIAADMAGEGSAQYQDYQQQKNSAINGWMAQADAAIAERKYVYAATFLRKILGLDPDNQTAKEKLSVAEQEGFEAAFRQALEDSKPDLALAELKRISVSPLFAEVKDSLESSINILHDFYMRQGVQQVNNQQLEQAYQSIIKGREIRVIQGRAGDSLTGSSQLVGALVNAAGEKAQQQDYGRQLAYLEMAYELNPNRRNLLNTLTAARRFIVGYAGTSLLVKDFDQTGSGHSAGKSVPQQVYDWMRANLAGDVLLITEQQYNNSSTNRPGKILLLEGDILQAGIDTDTSDGRRTMRVTTYTDKAPNPAYQEWVEDGQKGTAPDEFLIDEHQENITVNEIYVKKTGILSLSFRLVQPNGQVLLSDQARAMQTLEGEGNEGLSIGEFRLPYRRPQVASDIEIMESLSLSAAQEIGQKLSESLTADDQNYARLAQQSLSSGMVSDALNYMAYVSAIRSLRKDASEDDKYKARQDLIATALR